MKRLGYTLAISSMLFLTACGSEMEILHNETYYGTVAVSEDNYMEKPIDELVESVIEDTEDAEDAIHEPIEVPEGEEKLTTESAAEKSEFKSAARKELEKRVEKKQEAKPAEKPTSSTKGNEKPAIKKEKVTETVKVTNNSEKQAKQDWQSTINKISKETIEPQAKIRKLTTFNEKYIGQVTKKEIQQFQQTLLKDFNTGNFTAAIGNDEAMLTYIFKSYIVSEKTSKQNNYSLYMFMTTFNAFLEDLYLVPNTITDTYLDKQIDKLYRIYTTIE